MEEQAEYKVASVVTQNPWRCLSCRAILGFWEQVTDAFGWYKQKALKLYKGKELVVTCYGEVNVHCPKCGKVRIWGG